MLALFICTTLLAVALPIATRSRVRLADIETAALLLSLSIAYSISTLRSERARVLLQKARLGSGLTNMLATWTFPVAVLLPPVIAGITIVLIELCQWPVRNFEKQGKPHRAIYSTSALLISVWCTHQVLHSGLALPLRYVIAIASYELVNTIFVCAAMALTGSISSVKYFVKSNSYGIECLTLLLAGAQIVMIDFGVPLSWLSLPVVLLIQRGAIRLESHQGEPSHAAPDEAPLMTEKVWGAVAREVIKACDTASILRLDTGDPVAARAIAQMQAGCDAVGAVGASGLVILLADCPGPNADSLALRLRSALSSAGVQANVAVAAKPRDGHVLEDLLAVTEAELITRDAATRSARSLRPDA
jgi:hypothetical protein